MRIEKLNENQIKFILNHDDLKSWDIKLTELTQGTERTYELFHDIMEQAMMQCDFHVENTPILIEAIPHSADGVVIIVTKVINAGELEERFCFPPVSKMLERFRSKTADPAMRFTKQDPKGKPEPISVFSFSCLDEVSSASSRLKDHFWGHSALYKCEGRYYLLFNHDANSSRLGQADIEAMLSEYGNREVATVYSSYYLAEHGETIIAHSAVSILAKL